MRVLLANQNRGNVLNEYQSFFSYYRNRQEQYWHISCFTLNVMTELELVAFPLLHTLERVYISYISQLRTREDDEGFRLENFLFRSVLL